MTGQSLLPSVSLGAAEDLAPVDRLVSVALGVALEVLLPGEGLVAVLALVHSLYLDPPATHLYVFLRSVKCHNLITKLFRNPQNYQVCPNLSILLCVEFVLGESFTESSCLVWG